MSVGPWFLPLGSYAIVVKVDAVDRSFPGGLSAFQGTYSPIGKREVHLMILAFTEVAAEGLLAELEAAGLVRGVDVAASDMLGRPWVPCAGIAFRRHRGSTYLRWMVDVCDDSQAIVEEPLAPAWIALVSPEGHLRYSIQDDDAGIIIASREGFGSVDTWDEYLCAFQTRWGFTLGVYRYQWLGAVPDNWFDEDGVLQLEYAGGDGDVMLPEEVDGCRVLGHRYGGFVGEFQKVCASSWVEISDNSDSLVQAALSSIGWDPASWPQAQYALQRLGELKGWTVDPNAGDHFWDKLMGTA